MRTTEIVAVAQEGGLFTDEMYSRTPQKSMQARLSMDIIKRGSESKFVRAGRGLFFLRELITAKQASSGDTLPLESTVPVEPFEATPRRPKASDEKILVIPAQDCRDNLDFQGLKTRNYSTLKKMLGLNPRHMPRTDAESNIGFKQVITYTVITRGERVLSFRRGRFNRAANFLRGSACIGFGGHVSDEDYSLFTMSDYGIRQNAAREISAEIKVGGQPATIPPEKLEFVGIINDDSSDIGRHHFAVVYHLDVSGDEYSHWDEPMRGEMSINELQWLDTQSSDIDLIRFEYWSLLCWRMLWPKTAMAQPSFRILKRKNFKGDHILAIVGGIGSGKSFTTRHLREHYGYHEINSGRALSEILGIPPVPHTSRFDFQQAAWAFISAPDGPRILAERLVEEARRCGHDRVILDGIRQMRTLEEIKSISEIPVAQLFVHATPDLAMQLYTSREGNEHVEPITFMDMINAEVERNISVLMHGADAVIYNWIGETDYPNALDRMAEKLKIMRRTNYDY